MDINWRKVGTKALYILAAAFAAFMTLFLSYAIFWMFNTDTMATAMMADTTVLLFFGYLYWKFKFKNKDKAFVLHEKPTALKLGILLVLFVIITTALNTLFAYIVANIDSTGMDERSDTIAELTWTYIIVFSVILAPICEELTYRLFIYNFLKKEFNWKIAMFISCFLFGIMHGTGPHLVIGMIMGMGCVMVNEISGCQYVSIGCHILYNFLTIFVPSQELAESGAFTIGCLVVIILIYIGLIIRTESVYDKAKREETAGRGKRSKVFGGKVTGKLQGRR